MDSYDIGDRVRIEATFKDDAGTPVDPTTVHLGILPPDGTAQLYEKGDAIMENPEVGTYAVEVTSEATGKHRFRWLATGPGAGAEEGYFWVNLNSMDTVVT